METILIEGGESRPLKTGAEYTLVVKPSRVPVKIGTPAGGLVACRFEDGADLGGAETAWLHAECAGMENEQVQLVLEREEEGGWTEVSSAVSTVKAGEVHTGIPVGEP